MKKDRATYTVRVHHFHDGNSSKKERHNSAYMTVARLVDDSGAVLSEAVARCRYGDAPSRKEGRTLAVGRLLAAIKPGTSVRVV